jgi:RNA polymerase sigma-70 factor (ECF subfamily)
VPEVQADQVTGLLQRWVRGDEKALGILLPLVYQELHRLAHHHLRSERVGHTLQSTALVNEAFLRLHGSNPVLLQNRGHFIAVASRVMRQILVDYARSRGAQKRDGGYRIALEDLGELPSGEEDVPIVALDQALDSLSKIDERQGRIVEMKFFGGLSAAEIAAVLNISLATVERKWATARIWLRREMKRSASP